MHKTAIIAAFGLLASCASSTGDIELDEHNLPMPTLRMSFHKRVPARSDQDGAQVDPRAGTAAELSGTYTFGDLDLGAPDQGDFDLLEVALAVRGSPFGSDDARLDFIGGVAYNRFDFDTGGATPINDNYDRFGPIVGLQFAWEAVSRLTVYGRATIAGLIPDALSGQAEVGLQVGITENLRLLGAYRYWRYRHEDIDTGGASVDVDLKTTGYVFGLDLSF